MKTLKAIMIVVLLATAIVNQAATEGLKNTLKNRVVEINVIQAMQDPQLAQVIHGQVSISLLSKDKPFYDVKIDYKNYTFRVYGIYEQWIWFFAPYLENSGKKRVDQRLD